MAQNKVFIIFQDTEDARPFIDAFERENPEATLDFQPGIVRIEADGRLAITRETVEELMGREVDLQELHLVLVSLSGNVDEDEDAFSIAWNS
jgi:phenol hydroxylase P2 protein